MRSGGDQARRLAELGAKPHLGKVKLQPQMMRLGSVSHTLNTYLYTEYKSGTMLGTINRGKGSRSRIQ